MLEYRVESSDKYHIYRVRFEDEGDTLKAFCTCPAYKKAGLFCKHVASLLNGDESIIIEPSDKIEELKKVSINSPLIDKAKTYIPYAERKTSPSRTDIKTIKDIDKFDEDGFNEKKDKFSKKLYERTTKLFDKFYIKFEERKKLFFECGLPKEHFVKFGAIPKGHPQQILMDILRKYEDLGILINNKEIKITIKNEFYEFINKKYTGYPNIDKKKLPIYKFKRSENDKAREKIEDLLRDNIEYLIDEFIKYDK
jgi:hypothetical protein